MEECLQYVVGGVRWHPVTEACSLTEKSRGIIKKAGLPVLSQSRMG